MTPLKPVSRRARVWLGISFFVLFVAVWAAVTLSGFVSKIFLADPVMMVQSGWMLPTKMGFAEDIGMTMWRVFGGFAIAAVLAVPLGVAMGAYKPIEALFEPFVSFARYLPASAFIPLLILWAGIGEAQKLSLIFIGSFFQLVLMIAVVAGNTRRDLVEAAYTLGCGDTGIVRRVLVMSARPGRIKFECAVPFAHPRHYSIKTSPAFVALKAELTEQVRAEVLASVALAA